MLLCCVVLQFIEKELHEDIKLHKLFHHHQDAHDHISVKDVWGSWYKSEGEL